MAMTKGSKRQFQEAVLKIMDRKHHWAWPHFSTNRLTKAQLKIHFQQEYAVYVRDFPVFLARIHGQSPPAEVRRMLAENIYEEDTGGLSLGRSHPDLFLTMMEGMGYPRTGFDRIALFPASRTYRAWLDRVSASRDWVIGAAALTIFVEGSVNDRQEISNPSKPKTKAEIEEIVKRHPLVQHHGVSPDCMDLVRAHQMVEAGHRQDAHAMVLTYAVTATQRQNVLACLNTSLRVWLRYRDAVARACGLQKP
jgi:pyrroloquinoline quinone (PQQ) biosynthesis protein C